MKKQPRTTKLVTCALYYAGTPRMIRRSIKRYNPPAPGRLARRAQFAFIQRTIRQQRAWIAMFPLRE